VTWVTRSQPRSLLSIPRLNMARMRVWLSIESRVGCPPLPSLPKTRKSAADNLTDSG
jgi:hypothetical protein